MPLSPEVLCCVSVPTGSCRLQSCSSDWAFIPLSSPNRVLESHGPPALLPDVQGLTTSTAYFASNCWQHQSLIFVSPRTITNRTTLKQNQSPPASGRFIS